MARAMMQRTMLQSASDSTQNTHDGCFHTNGIPGADTRTSTGTGGAGISRGTASRINGQDQDQERMSMSSEHVGCMDTDPSSSLWDRFDPSAVVAITILCEGSTN